MKFDGELSKSAVLYAVWSFTCWSAGGHDGFRLRISRRTIYQSDQERLDHHIIIIHIKKDWKTTLLLLSDYAIGVELSSSLSLPQPLYSRRVFLCFHPFLVSVPFTGPSKIVVNIYRKFFSPS